MAPFCLCSYIHQAILTDFYFLISEDGCYPALKQQDSSSSSKNNIFMTMIQNTPETSRTMRQAKIPNGHSNAK